ncbi:MAG: transferase [Bacteroidia bacterium]|nr:transferase [Bacteroidia bacterium]
MNILFPGRHHLLTDFQFKYLYRIVENGLEFEPDIDGKPLGIKEKVTRIIFPVTSANHSNTRRNPVPFHLRAMALLDFGQELRTETFVFGIDDVGHLDDFAAYTLKKIHHESEGQIDLTPENCLVACSSPVFEMYEQHGFRILPVERMERGSLKMLDKTPWEIVEAIARAGEKWQSDRMIMNDMHIGSHLIWSKYRLGAKVQMLFNDDIIGADGDLTETRDYNSYVRQMDDIAELKFRETAPFIQPGRIGDIGCAVGSWIKLACREEGLRECDFFGIEVSRKLYQECIARKERGDFGSPYIFFSQKNAVTGLAFDAGSMNTIHTSSLTHEIESYGDREDLYQFIQNRYDELAPGGLWINRDVIGPEDPEKVVLLKLNDTDGANENWEKEFSNRDELAAFLRGLSTRSRFLRFARDFRAGSEGRIVFEWKKTEEGEFAQMTLRDAMEFISKKDYADNWQSEMHERFCFWRYEDYKNALEKTGFHITPNSKPYTNTWLVENRYRGHADLFEEVKGKIIPLPYPVTHMMMIGAKRV